MNKQAHVPLGSSARQRGPLWLWYGLFFVAFFAAWQLGGCEPPAPTEPQSEATSEQRADTIVDGRDGRDSPDQREPSPPEPPDEPMTADEPTTDGPSEPPDTSEPVSDTSEPVAPDASEPADASEPPSEPGSDGVDGGEPGPDSGESMPEGTAEQPPDMTGQCQPHKPPTSAANEWVYDTGEGLSFATAKAIKADAQGFLYVCGSFTGGPATFHGQTLEAPSGGEQMFVMKLDAAGKALWVYALPGQGSRACQALLLKANGAIVITGSFSGSVAFGGKTLTAQGYDVFVAELNTCGELQWIVQAGGKNSDNGYDLAFDGQGQLYVYGQFYGPATFGTQTVTSQDVGSIFVAKMTPQGAFTWVATGGSQAPDTPAGFGVTPQGEVYLAGSSFLPVTFGSFTLSSTNPFELFAAKLDTKGKWLWATQTTGTGRIVPYRAGLDASGRFYITGELDGEKTFDQTKYTSPPHGDIFLTQLDNAGKFKWVLRPQGTSHLHPNGLAFDGAAKSIFITGDYTGSPTFGSTQLTNAGNLRSFVTRVNTTATPSFTWTTSTKGTEPVRTQAITLGPNGDLFIAGNFQTSGTFGSITRTRKQSKYYVFVWKVPKP